MPKLMPRINIVLLAKIGLIVLAYMLFSFCYNMLWWLMTAACVMQVGSLLLYGRSHPMLSQLLHSNFRWFSDIMHYLMQPESKPPFPIDILENTLARWLFAKQPR